MFPQRDSYFGGGGRFPSYPEVDRSFDLGFDGRPKYGDRGLDDLRDPSYPRRHLGDFSGTVLREEDWRRSSFMRRSDSLHDVPSDSWILEGRPSRTAGSGNWRKEDYRSSGGIPGDDWRRERSSSSWRRSPPPNGRSLHSPHYERRSRHSPDRDRSPSFGRRREERPTRRRESSVPAKKRTVKDLDDEELEKAARLQLKLMAQQKGKEGMGEADPDEEEESVKKSVKKEDEREKRTGGEQTSKVKEDQKDATSKGTKKSNATGSDDHLSKSNRAEKEAQRSPDDQNDKQPRSDEEPPKGGTLVLKKNFEEVHMLGREKAASVAAPYPVKSGEPTWVAQYMMSVEKRKQELRSGLPVVPVGPVPRVPVPRASYDVERTTAVRYPTRFTDFGGREAPVPLGKRAVERDFIEEPDTRRRRPPYYEEEEPRSYPKRGIDREETEVGRRRVQFYDGEEPSPRTERDMEREEADTPRRRAHYYEEDEPRDRLERSINREGTDSPRKRPQYFEEIDSRPRLERSVNREEAEVPRKRPQYYEEEERRTPMERNVEREETDGPRRRPQYYEEEEPRRRPERNVEREEPAARRRNPLYYDEDEPTSYPERNMDREPPRPKSRTTIDPNQFVEELSDSEDWDQIAEVVNVPRMRSPFDDDLERPVRQGLLGPPPPVLRQSSKRPLLAERPAPERRPYPPLIPKLPIKPLHDDDKSFFRMEYPSIAPKIYFSGHSKERIREEPTEEKGPVQAHIAPAKPLFGDVGVGWRHESASPLIPEPPARYRPAGGVVSKHGGYFD